jgi:lipopolysaccharide transport system ATP-binding protein
MEPAIRVEHLSKRYRLGPRSRNSYRTLRETITDSLMQSWRRWRNSARRGGGEFLWALDDVSFEIQPGEVVGIIGRNGAGKSTLLKILSRITEPTSGRVLMRGRIGSLLEVGTGFHHELTGRENIYLSGAILGMKRQEIQRRFDDIVAFAEVEQFLDMPVKRYSSGMYVRLAFAVAAHLEPDILVVDEVLAVGDAAYQRRCIQHMAKLARSGRTVLLVSHNMDLIPRLCTRGILLEHGQVAHVGAAAEVVESYLAANASSPDEDDLSKRSRTGGDGRARFKRLQLLDGHGRPQGVHVSGADLVVRMEVTAHDDIGDAALAVTLRTLTGTNLVSSWTREANVPIQLRRGTQTIECRFRALRIRPGRRLSVLLWLETENCAVDFVEDARIFEVVDGPDTRGVSTDAQQGFVLCAADWQTVDMLAEV